MKLVVGLGNPGTKYIHSRHNAGFMLVDYLEQSATFPANVRFLKPQTFMNKSGDAVSRELNFYKLKPEDLIVVHDDLDLKLGEFKIQKGKGPKVHNGVNHVEERLGTKEFWRVRLGVDNRPSSRLRPASRITGDSYVLANFLPEEKARLEKLFPEIVRTLRITPGVIWSNTTT
jgi:PTH1 family peptidyl-tRNA hydrolase